MERRRNRHGCAEAGGFPPNTPEGTDAPICQDKRLGCLRDVSAHAEVCHNTLVDFTGEEAFEAADDLASGPAATGLSVCVEELGFSECIPYALVLPSSSVGEESLSPNHPDTSSRF